jgi:Peptidase family M28
MKILKRIVFSILIFFIALFIWAKIYSIEPALVTRKILADTVRIKSDLNYLTKECQFRNFMHPEQLNKSADYIKSQFAEIADTVEFQTYDANDLEFKNVICSLGPKDAERIIIGAHYDACLDQEGADDNASGVCGLLELARLLKNEKLKYRIDFVAYSNEEPPFFKTKNMGSYIHAKSLFDNSIKVKGMICLEMIGVYFDEPDTQDYPAFFLEWFYGNKGNFITIVQKFSNGDFGDFVSTRMKKEQVIPTKSFSAPAWIAGVGLSDQINYWDFGYSAVMITNTAFYRNKKYHTVNDTPERLDIEKMSQVVDELYRTLIDVK